jgi:AraC-like DNA-binding protein
MLLLDTRPLPHADRPEAFSAAMQGAATPCRIDRREPDDELHVTLHVWSYARSALMATDATPFRLTRSPRHVRTDSAPVVCLSFQAAGTAEFAQRGHEQLVHGRDLMLVDMDTPYVFGCRHGGGARALLVDHGQLGLPMDVVRRATPRLRASPLHDLVRAHLERVVAAAPSLAADPGAAALETATIGLLRALVVSAAGEVAARAAVREETLVARVQAYVAQHLTDPSLTPASIAAAHAVSVRLLYRAYAQAGLSLEQEVITARLHAAREALVSPAGRRRSIAATARACGFADLSHFARRFRAAYGMTPREWQRLGTAGGRPAPSSGSQR